MAKEIKLVVFPVTDLEMSKALYSAFLGVEPYADSPYYVGYKAGETEIGLVPSEVSVVAYVDVDDIEATLKELVQAGATVRTDPMSVGGGAPRGQCERRRRKRTRLKTATEVVGVGS